jgi:hypothetical protein
MESFRKDHEYIDYAISLIIGISFVFAAIIAFGYGAAVAIPKSILHPLVSFSPIFAFTLVDFFTQGIPAVLIFALLSLAIKLSKVKAVYTLLAMPFVLFMLSALPELLASKTNSNFYLASVFAKTLPVVVCALFLAKQNKVSNSV